MEANASLLDERLREGGLVDKVLITVEGSGAMLGKKYPVKHPVNADRQDLNPLGLDKTLNLDVDGVRRDFLALLFEESQKPLPKWAQKFVSIFDDSYNTSAKTAKYILDNINRNEQSIRDDVSVKFDLCTPSY